MPRKPKKGYYVKGQFVAAGSELDLQLKAENKGTAQSSKTDQKRESQALQSLGQELLTLREALFARLLLPENLQDALAEAKRITDFEGKRRQMQFVGKLMRTLDEEQLDAIRAALEEQRSGSAAERLLLHQAENWRERLVADDNALGEWLAQYPDTDTQHLRTLIRQARKDTPDAHHVQVAQSLGLVPRKGRAWREIFQYVRNTLQQETP